MRGTYHGVNESAAYLEFPMPFKIGEIVTWSPDTPETWRYIYTPGPMTVISSFWHDGEPSEYAKRFDFKIDPGWVYEVEYDADSTDYYNPPLSLFFGKRLVKIVHEKWLVPWNVGATAVSAA